MRWCSGNGRAMPIYVLWGCSAQAWDEWCGGCIEQCINIDNIDELDLKLAEFGKEDKVLVSVRCVYGSNEKLLVSKHVN